MKVPGAIWQARWSRLVVGVVLGQLALIGLVAGFLPGHGDQLRGTNCGMPYPPRLPLPPVPAFPPPPPWTERYDFDGDHQPDRVHVTFSAGAHCCYTLAIQSSAHDRTIAIPFWMDGGYVGGLDLGQPEHFTVDVGPDGVASLVMEVATYNGRAEPIPKRWRRRHGVRSHRVRVGLAGARLRVENLAWVPTS